MKNNHTKREDGSQVRAKKHLGQHFLTDLNIARKIADAVGAAGCAGAARSESTAAERTGGATGTPGGAGDAERGTKDAVGAERGTKDVLEVGPGTGVLTRFLLERDDVTLYAAEIDRESVEYLRVHFPALGDRLTEGDFLQMDLKALFPGGVIVAGNFPYNISSQIFFKVLENRDIVPEVVGMVQREVAVRIAEPPGSREYGILSVLLQVWYDIEYLFTVNESVFNPPPKVKSAVIRLRRNGVRELGCDERLFVRVVKAAFGQRRKMVRNALKAVFGDFGGQEHRFFTTRAEQLSVADFVELTQWVADNLTLNGK